MSDHDDELAAIKMLISLVDDEDAERIISIAISKGFTLEELKVKK